MAFPIALVGLISPIIERFIDKKKLTSKTNISTFAGGSLMATSFLLIQQPDEISQGIGYLIGGVGFLISLYKESK